MSKPASHILVSLFHRLQFESHEQQGNVPDLGEIGRRSLIVLSESSQQRSATMYFALSSSLENPTPLSGKIMGKQVKIVGSSISRSC